MRYDKFLQLAQKYKAGQSSSEVHFLELLVEQEADIINWKDHTGCKSWAEVLKREGFCTPATYSNYKRARERIPRMWVERFGVHATINIAKLDEGVRDQIFGRVKTWYHSNRMTPTYQRVSTYVKSLGIGTSRRRGSNKVQKMKAYIRRCQALLNKNQIPIPRETWS